MTQPQLTERDARGWESEASQVLGPTLGKEGVGSGNCCPTALWGRRHWPWGWREGLVPERTFWSQAEGGKAEVGWEQPEA